MFTAETASLIWEYVEDLQEGEIRRSGVGRRLKSTLLGNLRYCHTLLLVTLQQIAAD